MGEGRGGEAVEILAPVAHDPEAAGLLARVRLSEVDLPDVHAAIAALAREDREAALSHLVDAIPAIPRADADARELLREAVVGIFRELGDQHPLTMRFRRRLARALY